jgi:hypothetical protein
VKEVFADNAGSCRCREGGAAVGNVVEAG